MATISEMRDFAEVRARWGDPLAKDMVWLTQMVNDAYNIISGADPYGATDAEVVWLTEYTRRIKEDE